MSTTCNVAQRGYGASVGSAFGSLGLLELWGELVKRLRKDLVGRRCANHEIERNTIAGLRVSGGARIAYSIRPGARNYHRTQIALLMSEILSTPHSTFRIEPELGHLRERPRSPGQRVFAPSAIEHTKDLALGWRQGSERRAARMRPKSPNR